MIKSGLEKFDSPVVFINQLYNGEDWGVVASYVSEAKIGWHVSVTLPDFEDVDMDKIFSTPEAALEYGISQILSGDLTLAAPPSRESKAKVYSFGDYEKIA